MAEPDSISTRKQRRAIRFSIVNTIMVSIAVLLAIGLSFITHLTARTSDELQAVTDEYIDCENAVVELSDASIYLTSQARMFVLSFEPPYLRRYINESENTNRREHAVSSLAQRTQDDDAEACLNAAMDRSKSLEETELYAMKLIIVARGISQEQGAKEFSEVALSEKDEALPADEKIAKAKDLLFGVEYQVSRGYIDGMTRKCKDALIETAHEEQNAIEGRLRDYMAAQMACTLMLLAIIIAMTIVHIVLMQRPLRSFTTHLNKNEPIEPVGAEELQRFARAYNGVLEENLAHQADLTHAAEHDPLTDLLNRNAYDKLYEDNIDDQALLLIDVDYFKSINDKYGHDVGDAVLKLIASALRHVFRSTDYPCRIGGDEFAILMPHVNSDLKHVIEERLDSIRKTIDDTRGELPPLTLSIGVAFSGDVTDGISLYKAADLALYHVKSRGRNGQAFYCDLRE